MSMTQYVPGLTHPTPLPASDPTTARGDLSYRGVTDPTRLPLGLPGSILSSNGADPLWRNQANSAWIFDDWISSAQNGSTSWQSVTANSGTAALIASVAGHPGMVGISTAGSATAQSALMKSGTATSCILGNGKISLRLGCRIDPLGISDGTNRFIVRFGLTDKTTGLIPTNGVIFDCTDNVNSGKWRGVVMVADVANVCSGAANAPTVVAGTWYDLRIIIAADAQSVEFFVNGISIGTVVSNMSGYAQAISIAIEKTLGTSNRQLQVDYFEMVYDLTAARYTV